jgi:peptidoglycan hydrolase-like protein with peptidoglycan-binding domain
MKLVRAARLALLTFSLAGLGVPATFGQAAISSKGKTASKEKTSGSTSQAKAGVKKKPSVSSSPKSRNASSANTKTHSVKPSAQPVSAAKKTSSRSSSKKTRRQPGQKAPAADRVSEIQAALARDGSFQGSPTGKWDDNTTAAMRRFQASHGLNPSGKLDARTLQRLGLGSGTAGVAAPTPPPGAVSRLTSSASAATGPLDSGRRP